MPARGGKKQKKRRKITTLSLRGWRSDAGEKMGVQSSLTGMSKLINEKFESENFLLSSLFLLFSLFFSYIYILTSQVLNFLKLTQCVSELRVRISDLHV